MPYLNWKDPSKLQQQIGPHGLSATGEPSERGLKQCLTLSFDGERLVELLPLLREAFEPETPRELRVDLPRNWIVFWKIRDGESRMLIAHPQEDEWVATVALSSDHGALLLERLEKLSAGQSFSLGELAPTGGASNLELTLACL